MASVSAVASTAPWPGRAWSEWPCVITARGTGPAGSMKKSPGTQWRPEGPGLSQLSKGGEDAMTDTMSCAAGCFAMGGLE